MKNFIVTFLFPFSTVPVLEFNLFLRYIVLTLYPEDLMCTPLFVSVDFIRMKKDRSRELSGARRLGLLDSTATKTDNTKTESDKCFFF